MRMYDWACKRSRAIVHAYHKVISRRCTSVLRAYEHVRTSMDRCVPHTHSHNPLPPLPSPTHRPWDRDMDGWISIASGRPLALRLAGWLQVLICGDTGNVVDRLRFSATFIVFGM